VDAELGDSAGLRRVDRPARSRGSRRRPRPRARGRSSPEARAGPAAGLHLSTRPALRVQRRMGALPVRARRAGGRAGRPGSRAPQRPGGFDAIRRSIVEAGAEPGDSGW